MKGSFYDATKLKIKAVVTHHDDDFHVTQVGCQVAVDRHGAEAH